MGCGQGMVEVCAVKRISCTFVVKIPLPVLPLDMLKRPSERAWGKRGTRCVIRLRSQYVFFSLVDFTSERSDMKSYVGLKREWGW